MKTKLPLFAVGLLAALFAGCVVQSINPLFAEKEFIAFPNLVGTWAQKEGDKEQGVWVFAADGQQYKLTHTDDSGHKAMFHVAAGQIGTNVFLDSFLEDLIPHGEMNDFATVHLVPTHAFIKIRKTGAGLTLVLMDLDWLTKHLTENPKALAHIMRPSGGGDERWPLLTASTGELQKFVAQYANDDKVFKNEIKLVPKPSAK